MGHTLNGHATFHDREHSLILGGGVALRSDGVSRSEIDITNPETGDKETLVFTTGSTWIPVHQLILLIRELFVSNALDLDISATTPPCELCDGTGMYEDDDGNWHDCSQCVP